MCVGPSNKAIGLKTAKFGVFPLAYGYCKDKFVPVTFTDRDRLGPGINPRPFWAEEKILNKKTQY